MVWQISILQDQISRYGAYMSKHYRQELLWKIDDLYEQFFDKTDFQEMLEKARDGIYDNWDNEREDCIKEESPVG